MQTQLVSGKKTHDPFSLKILRFILNRSPSKYKRRFFIASLIPKVSNLTTSDTMALMKLNESIVKAKDYKFVAASMLASDFFWSDLNQEKVSLSTGETVKLSEAVASCGVDAYIAGLSRLIQEKMPACLRYGSTKLIQYDIESTVREAHMAGA